MRLGAGEVLAGVGGFHELECTPQPLAVPLSSKRNNLGETQTIIEKCITPHSTNSTNRNTVEMYIFLSETCLLEEGRRKNVHKVQRQRRVSQINVSQIWARDVCEYKRAKGW